MLHLHTTTPGNSKILARDNRRRRELVRLYMIMWQHAAESSLCFSFNAMEQHFCMLDHFIDLLPDQNFRSNSALQSLRRALSLLYFALVLVYLGFEVHFSSEVVTMRR